MIDMSHLTALEIGLSHERARLAAAVSPKERELRAVWVAQCEHEIAAEKKFIGYASVDCALSDDELLAELMA